MTNKDKDKGGLFIRWLAGMIALVMMLSTVLFLPQTAGNAR